MLIGNKCDMEDRRQVTREKGETVCDSRVYKFDLSDKFFSFSWLEIMALNSWKRVRKVIL